MSYPIVHIPDPTRHAFASPSKLAAIKLCPFTAKCCDEWESPMSEAAGRGKSMHEAVYNNTALDKLSSEDREIILNLRREFIKPCSEYELWYEKLLYLYDEAGKVITYGTVDFLAVRDNTALLIDWKFGNSPVPGYHQNPQLRAYVAAVFQAFPQLEIIYPMIAQPSVGYDVGYENQVVVTRASLPDLVRETAEIVASARAAKPGDAKPSNDACVFCNKEGCKKYHDSMVTALEFYTGNAEVPAAVDMPALTPEALLAWCDDALPKLSLMETFVRDRIGKVKEYIKKQGGSESYRLTKPIEKTTVDYKTMISDLGIPTEVVERYTTVKIYEPQLIKKNRKRG
ncbi:DUF2800 domain-containing protein [bacterium]|nr:DUF2800 domain-containing protein [bacterium]